MKVKLVIALLAITLFVTTKTVYAQDGNPPKEQPFLSSQQVYNLVLFAVIGSLGTLGLLLGVDRFIAIVPRNKEPKNTQRISAQHISRILPIVIEGITVILVVLAILLLGLLRITTSEGTIGILGAIVGYVLGKGTQQGKPSPTDLTTQEE